MNQRIQLSYSLKGLRKRRMSRPWRKCELKPSVFGVVHGKVFPKDALQTGARQAAQDPQGLTIQNKIPITKRPRPTPIAGKWMGPRM